MNRKRYIVLTTLLVLLVISITMVIKNTLYNENYMEEFDLSGEEITNMISKEEKQVGEHTGYEEWAEKDKNVESEEKMSEETKFGYNVEIESINRENSLIEDDFKKLRKGQYIISETAEYYNSEYTIGIIESIGMFDGQILHNHRSGGTGFALTTPYYIIDENTYIMLFFENNDIIRCPLDHIEVWDAEGNKLRDIEIE